MTTALDIIGLDRTISRLGCAVIEVNYDDVTYPVLLNYDVCYELMEVYTEYLIRDHCSYGQAADLYAIFNEYYPSSPFIMHGEKVMYDVVECEEMEEILTRLTDLVYSVVPPETWDVYRFEFVRGARLFITNDGDYRIHKYHEEKNYGRTEFNVMYLLQDIADEVRKLTSREINLNIREARLILGAIANMCDSHIIMPCVDYEGVANFFCNVFDDSPAFVYHDVFPELGTRFVNLVKANRNYDRQDYLRVEWVDEVTIAVQSLTTTDGLRDLFQLRDELYDNNELPDTSMFSYIERLKVIQ